MADDKKQEIATEQARHSGKDVPPSITRHSFCCPHCGTYTHQYWYTLLASRMDKGILPFIPTQTQLDDYSKLSDLDGPARKFYEQALEKYSLGNVFLEDTSKNYGQLQASSIHLSRCYTCDKVAVWVHQRLVHPPQRTGPAPNEDLPPDINALYEEARSILNLSARGAAALLRLCVEKLTLGLKAEGDTLDKRIADLVKKGLDARVQKALDAVRVIGNEAVHPGQMDLRDDPATAEALFKLVNIIAEKMISEPKHVDEVYGSLPSSKLAAIEKRDRPKE